jgi:hypothetical protein
MTDVTIPADVAKNEAAYLRSQALGLRSLDKYLGMAARLHRVADLLDPPTLTLREKVARVSRVWHGWGADTDPMPCELDEADAVLAVIADEMAKRPDASGLNWQQQRDADLAWLRGKS